MAVPAAIFVATFFGGIIAAGRWLPALGAGHVGDLAFALVCTLLGIALALVGTDIYELVREITITPSSGTGGLGRPDELASGLASILRDVGPVLGLAGVVYLLAPRSYR